MRRCYLVCYDIRNDKRLRRVHKLMKAYGEPWQYSVFYCSLRSIDRVRLELALREEMNQKEDQVLIVDLGANEESARESSTFMGAGVPEAESGVVVI
ncbi:CRISPR-associated endonuclease Cas2 [Candidatus Binatia bacterium]|nr:CRISPR-associated endonuclease Cas2 [Candidatus Binatia bacterium]